MYVNPFWVGVAATVLVELIALAVAIGVSMYNDSKKNNSKS